MMRPRKKQSFDALQTDVPADVEAAGPSKKYFFQLHPKLIVASKVTPSRTAVSNSSISNFKPRLVYVQSKATVAPQSVPPSERNFEFETASRVSYNYENIGYKMQAHRPFDIVVEDKSLHDHEDKPDLSGEKSNDHQEPAQGILQISPYGKEGRFKQFQYSSTSNLGNSYKPCSLKQILNISLDPKRLNTIPLKELHEYERASSVQCSAISKDESQRDLAHQSSMHSKARKSALKGSRAGESAFNSAQTDTLKKSVNFSRNILILKYQKAPNDKPWNASYQRIK